MSRKQTNKKRNEEMRRLRQEENWSHVKIAEKFGISREYVGKILGRVKNNIKKLRTTNQQLQEALEAVEFVNIENDEGDVNTQCPWCKVYAADIEVFPWITGHRAGCKRQTALEAARGLNEWIAG